MPLPKTNSPDNSEPMCLPSDNMKWNSWSYGWKYCHISIRISVRKKRIQWRGFIDTIKIWSQYLTYRLITVLSKRKFTLLKAIHRPTSWYHRTQCFCTSGKLFLPELFLLYRSHIRREWEWMYQQIHGKQSSV